MSNNVKTDNCKIVSYATIIKARGNDKMYQEAIEASSKFNKRLVNERKMRIPFLDSQTTVAQANCMIWSTEYQRTKANQKGYIYSYPVKSWYKNRRLAFENDSSNMLHRLHLPADLTQQQMNINGESGNHSLMDPNNGHHYHHHHNHHHHGHHHHPPHTLSKQTSNDDHHHEHHKGHSRTNGNENEWHDIHDNFNDLNENDVDSDADDYEDPKRKKSKRGRGKKAAAPKDGNDDKPFVCDRCGVKYKTKPGLTYHIQKAHKSSNISSTPSTFNNIHSSNSKTNDLIENENTNSVFDSVYDDMNSSSSLPKTSHQNSVSNTNFSSTLISNSSSALNAKTAVNKCGACNGSEQENRSGAHESFVLCSECNKSFHPLCLNFTRSYKI